jgi:hypothetical protein
MAGVKTGHRTLGRLYIGCTAYATTRLGIDHPVFTRRASGDAVLRSGQEATTVGFAAPNAVSTPEEDAVARSVSRVPTRARHGAPSRIGRTAYAGTRLAR